jgi:hypothetical protein
MPRKLNAPMSLPTGAILQLKIRLLDISPMIWRRVLVPVAFTLRELHGVIQVAMGWESLHLYLFQIRAVAYGSFQLSVESPDATMESFRFRKNAKFTYVYDMGAGWEHEIRVEDRLEAKEGQRYPVCTGGQGACPPEECGGPQAYQARREEALSYDALEDFDTMVSLLDAVVLKGKRELLDDLETRWTFEGAVERSKAREPFLAESFSRREVNARLRKGEHLSLMHQQW